MNFRKHNQNESVIEYEVVIIQVFAIGSCTVGLILPERPEEKVLIIEKGDAILCPIGNVTWWFNGGDSDVTIIFLGETSQSYTPGLFDYFFLTGALGVLRGFSTEFIAKAYDLNHEQSKHLVESQANALVVKIDAGVVDRFPHKCNCTKEEYVVNLDTESETDTERVGLSPKLVRLESEAVLDPYYSAAHQVMYVTKGGGRIQIVGLNGTRVLDEVVEEGHLIVVPKFFLVALMASDKGLECFCVSTSPRYVTPSK